MKTHILILVFVTTLMAACSSAAVNTEENLTTLSVSGAGFASTSPDIVDIQLGVESIRSDPAEAVSVNTAAMNDVMNVLNSMEIASEDIQTVYYSMWVEDVYDENGQLTGERRYRVTNQINVRLYDLDQTGVLLEKVINAGATTVTGITFGVDDTTELAQEALDNALIEARQKAERLAAEMGMTLGPVISIAEGSTNSIMPLDIKGLGGGGGGVPISEGQFSVTMTARIVYELIP
jgi:uncharacterized protein YggE